MASRILVVDDDSATRQMMNAALSDCGYAVTTVGTLPRAIEALAQDPPDLVITDIRLNGYNGLQLLATSPTPIPAIVVTGYRDHAIEAEARQMGAEYFVKPFQLPDLLAAVNEKLAHPRSRAEVKVPRRWTRKPLGEAVKATIGDIPARVVEVSYGGVRFEIERVPGQWLALSLPVALPEVSFGIDVVWKSRTSEASWMCGATVSENRQVWREVVDALS